MRSSAGSITFTATFSANVQDFCSGSYMDVTLSAATCLCTTGFGGADCSTYTACDSSPCQNQGTCNSVANQQITRVDAYYTSAGSTFTFTAPYVGTSAATITVTSNADLGIASETFTLTGAGGFSSVFYSSTTSGYSDCGTNIESKTLTASQVKYQYNTRGKTIIVIRLFRFKIDGLYNCEWAN